jgi:hypothetical protein
MRIVKKNIASNYGTSISESINRGDYYLAPNNYDFSVSNVTDVTTPELLEIFYEKSLIEYGVFRDSLVSIFIPIWNSLSFDSRKTCVKHYRYPANISQDEWNSYFSGSDQEMNWNDVCVKTRDMRLTRLFAAFQKISYNLTTTQTALIYMTTKAYCVDYYYANLPHVIFWLQNGTYSPLGIDFTTNGFAQASGYSTALRDELLDILINGNYVYTAKINF